MIYHRDRNIPQQRMRTKTKEKKEKKSIEKKFAATASSQTKKAAKPKNSFSDEAKKLKSDVKCINEKLMKEGERLFFTRLPEKIIELTEYIQVCILSRSFVILTICRINLSLRNLLTKCDRRLR